MSNPETCGRLPYALRCQEKVVGFPKDIPKENQFSYADSQRPPRFFREDRKTGYDLYEIEIPSGTAFA